MQFRLSYFIIFIIAGITILSASCKKQIQTRNTGGNLSFSTDTLTFDTVFTSLGSFTTWLKIYNPNSEQVSISSIRMLHGSSTYFRLNIDGAAGNTATNVKIAPNDSIYVFATVLVDPTNTATPFLISDSLVATLNGKDYYVPFEAYGQNAHYFVGDTLDTQTWIPDLPYVIIHSSQVNPGQTLTIKPGCRIYMHQDSRLIVEGTLLAKGTSSDTIVFQGDRLDRAYFGYQGYPGEWGGLYFTPYSQGSVLDYVNLENGGNTALNAPAAVIETVLDSVNDHSHPQLTITHSLIQNSLGDGIYNYAGTVVASNCLINTCGGWCFDNQYGGFDSLVNCTFVCYGTDKVDHTQYGTGLIVNYYVDANYNHIPNNLNAVMRNCIVYGSLENELICDYASGAAANLTIDHCLIKADSIASFVNNQHNILSKDPQFVNSTTWDYHLKAGSPAIGAGMSASGLTDDLEGNTRLPGNPYDLGCYIYKP